MWAVIEQLRDKPVPVFRLYGETSVWPTPDLIHCESIASRSRLHDWEIRPHRHGDLVQLLYVQSGAAELEVEGRVTSIREASLQVTPALAVHGFRFAEDVQGWVLSMGLPLAEQLGRLLESSVLEQPGCFVVGEGRRHLDSLFESIDSEYAQQSPGRDLMLQSLLNVLLVWLSRQALAQSRAETSQQDRGVEHVQAFARLLERDFRLHRPIEHYAAALGISAAHLNALCRRLAGQSALQMIHQRLLLEAKRQLVYTTQTIQQVSDDLGFSEPAYFSRFFKRFAGMSPRAFREPR
ncbi:helix-turn-helix domain-containing protein [Pseudomonas sp. ZM23]|uniref:Helix-turn-helix domain-containing protein n=1 Tax=Pseudomonas triclosanedens TaxID=2961893 RepID=A0ABY7A4H0_9PSED|nr:helix-turn-helix domain-containing protein [Pseudomonas triclosanedens]MCP8465591.1 helix-turn-helix domain-containing protein [Pseudomonas triclosanedens]MCP8471086.1 helix-turn-helix domain-containing protein [Pseudomonas triclosanedens]MCP8476890.1 helix-turn-helix domain-containing protein [Pseudomonas triclosanedens]WAI51998.1 helix-turn-helix domain-containing protein [Pseudomonas triclosanedens]